MKNYEQYQLATEKLKDDFLSENRKLTRQLSEKEQSFELVKMVHFNKHIDIHALKDIIIGCTGCLYVWMISNKRDISNLPQKSSLFLNLKSHRDEILQYSSLTMIKDLCPDYTTVVFPVGTSDLIEGHHHQISSIVMLYPNHLMDDEVLDFIKSFMVVNEVLINIVLTRERMTELIEKDPLTGALNRLSWKENLKRYLYDQSPFFITFIDLDNFKDINDQYGHPKGDEVLKFTSQWLKSVFRSDDKVFRLGGDEFAVSGFIDPYGGEDGLLEKAYALNRYFKSHTKETLGIEISASIGVLLTRGTLSEEETYQKVDQLLYESKKKGRDTITVASIL